MVDEKRNCPVCFRLIREGESCRCTREAWELSKEKEQGMNYRDYFAYYTDPVCLFGHYIDECDCEQKTQGKVW